MDRDLARLQQNMTRIRRDIRLQSKEMQADLLFIERNAKGCNVTPPNDFEGLWIQGTSPADDGTPWSAQNCPTT